MNKNHDPKDGKFTSKRGGSSGAKALKEKQAEARGGGSSGAKALKEKQAEARGGGGQRSAAASRASARSAEKAAPKPTANGGGVGPGRYKRGDGSGGNMDVRNGSFSTPATHRSIPVNSPASPTKVEGGLRGEEARHRQTVSMLEGKDKQMYMDSLRNNGKAMDGRLTEHFHVLADARKAQGEHDVAVRNKMLADKALANQAQAKDDKRYTDMGVSAPSAAERQAWGR